MKDAGVFTFLAALFVAVIATPLVRIVALKVGAVDKPNERSSHAVPTPRGGGAAIVLGIVCAILLVAAIFARTLDVPAAGILAGTVLIALLGSIDDIRSLPAAVRFGVQLVIAGGVILAGTRIGALSPDAAFTIGANLSVAMTAFWLVGMTNAYNFMDGINGIASVQGVVAGVALAVLFWRSGDSAGVFLALAAAGASLGFLPWNFPAARVFMGDVGSGALGFLFACLACRLSAARGSLLEGALPLAPFLFDTTLTLVRRIAARERWWSAHRSHLYQRLSRSGFSHTFVTVLWGGLAVVSACAALGVDGFGPVGRVAAVAIVLAAHTLVALWVGAVYNRANRPL